MGTTKEVCPRLTWRRQKHPASILEYWTKHANKIICLSTKHLMMLQCSCLYILHSLFSWSSTIRLKKELNVCNAGINFSWKKIVKPTRYYENVRNFLFYITVNNCLKFPRKYRKIPMVSIHGKPKKKGHSAGQPKISTFHDFQDTLEWLYELVLEWLLLNGSRYSRIDQVKFLEDNLGQFFKITWPK